MSLLKDIISKTKLNTEFDSITVGTVVDTNDVQQMGRVKVYCPAWDSPLVTVGDIPWAMYVAPFGGVSTVISRGSDDNNTSEGKVAYGAWHIPKIGANVLVMCLDKNPNYRVWLGCIFDQYVPHTMPHGRFLEDDENGPLTSKESPINPLNDNYTKAFTNNKKYEWKTRISDYSVASIDSTITNKKKSESSVPDEKTGYELSRIDPDIKISQRDNLDSQVYSWVTPGFHAFSMDDREKNCRMRFRTSHGHQIILDDTNERIYILTSEGGNWIELDQKGNIDIYADRRISIRSKKDINLTSDETIRFHGKKGIHMSTDGGDIRLDAKDSDVHIKSGNNLIINCVNNLSLSANSFNLLTNTDISLETPSKLNLKGNFTYLTGNDSVLINGKSSVLVSSSIIHLNGPAAPSASSPDILNINPAYWTNRIPDHEPWARGVVKSPDNNTNHTSEFSVDDENVNKVENGESLNRGQNWKR